MTTATVTSKGRVTIPKRIRDGLSLKLGDKLEMHLLSETRVILRVRKGRLSDFIGCIATGKRRLQNRKSRENAVRR